ncbi:MULTISPECIES: hypothetical protein [Streptomyces]|uniref:hypothetical protein n=1 Tax=Streptomyces TaxID=1883 RepID=UPI00345B6E60
MAAQVAHPDPSVVIQLGRLLLSLPGESGAGRDGGVEDSPRLRHGHLGLRVGP